MTDSKDQDRKMQLKLAQPGKLELKKTVETGQVRQSFSHGRSKVVTVEKKQTRRFTAAGGSMHEVREGARGGAEAELAMAMAKVEAAKNAASVHDLTSHEKEARARALEVAMKAEEDARRRAEEEAARRAEEDAL
ncbi:MAG TPA: translation initiation factor IF-2 associated domain-containing protein, partial [Candidatus Omnitrophota bacterium]|nr:translation initiation factor IF-2 associated domain-containing protein [Candidatus Omnitrophota bacterium]